jgi:hypothetical protein
MVAVRRLVLLTVAVVGLAPLARAAEVEERKFVTFLDGQRVGDYHVKITQEDDGSISQSSQGQMQLTLPNGAAHYRYRGHETWKDGQLQRLDSTSTDDTKQTKVSATAESQGLRVVVGASERMLVGPVWSTTYWQLPPADVRTQKLTLLDADTGRDVHGKLEPLGTGQVVIAGQPVSCMRYRVTGSTQVDLWYDAQQRLVRQEWSQDNHRVVLELKQVKH